MIHQNENQGVGANTVTSGKVWFITGASRGFGRIWTEAALERGDKVVATARSLKSVADLTEKYGENVLTLALEGKKDQAVWILFLFCQRGVAFVGPGKGHYVHADITRLDDQGE
jgi:NAD(P)-dependent dehydrogenase (short-subunit alcohol dehydrogenase family)